MVDKLLIRRLAISEGGTFGGGGGGGWQTPWMKQFLLMKPKSDKEPAVPNSLHLQLGKVVSCFSDMFPSVDFLLIENWLMYIV